MDAKSNRAAAALVVGSKGVGKKSPKGSAKEEKAHKATAEQRSCLGVRDAIIAKKQGTTTAKALNKLATKGQLLKTAADVSLLKPCGTAEKSVDIPANVLISPSAVKDDRTASAVTSLPADKAGEAKLESGTPSEARSTAANSPAARGSTKMAAGEGEGANAGGPGNIAGCDMSSWPDFSLDSLDGGEIDDIDMSGTIVLPELEEMSQKDHLPEGEPSGDTRPSETSSKGPQQTDNIESTCKSGSKNTNGKKKAKVDWTPELHRRFVQAVEQLGVEKAIPSRILELMGVKCLTRHNIASHLQKYRSHRRHLAAREAEAANWHNRKPTDGLVWPGAGKAAAAAAVWAYPNGSQSHPPMIQPRPVVGIPPPYQGYPMMPSHVSLTHPQPHIMSTTAAPVVGMPMHVWGHPTVDQSRSHMWPQQQQSPVPAYPSPAWFGSDGSVWQYGGFQAPPVMDAWGHPTMMVPGTPCYAQHQAPQQQQPMGFPMAPGGVACGTPVCGPGVMTPGGMPSSILGMSFQGPSAFPVPPPVAARGVALPETQEIIADEAMPNPMFPIPDDLSLDFADFTAGIGDDLHDTTDILDAAITEALTNPTTPLPLGLKPPSVDGVLEELNKQGITMPPAVPVTPPSSNPPAGIAEASEGIPDPGLAPAADAVNVTVSHA